MTEIKDSKYMLMLADRVYYHGLLGSRMKNRRFGAVSLYVAPKGSFRLKLGDGQWTREDVTVLPSYQTHQIVSDCGSIINVLIEPDRLCFGEYDALLDKSRDPVRKAALIDRIRAAARRLPFAAPDGDIATQEFDRIVLGRSLAQRRIDPRIQSALDMLEEEGLECQASAAAISDRIGLSSSRFLHLFKEQTSVSFRNFRMWRRARGFLFYANQNSSLTNVALSLGYPDSSHFSHSIRKTYGLQPRSIRIGSQNLRVDSSARVAAAMAY
ncbi:helix-turn-helix domain-containing protein [Sulfitobacter porphyrae]|uniref:Helix-turn-helix domain-containing protein n=1 Tax=Sulfitobacter porphyrae TaxID=1246864 RepID=A0ABW2B6S3_9RHOB|nr:transcriptional regulator [Sulfitobacter porphyrae]